MGYSLRAAGTFDPMAVHVGNLLREVYINSNFKMKALEGALLKEAEPGQPAESYSQKSIYRHFKEKDLDTGLIRAYDSAFRGLGLDVDLFRMLWMKERGIEEAPKAKGFRYASADIPVAVTAEPGGLSPLSEVARKLEDAALLLRREDESRRGKASTGPGPAPGQTSSS